MRSSFSKTFVPVALILLSALLVVGASFQALVQGFLREKAIEDLRSDAVTVSELAAAYSKEGDLTTQEFLMNLRIASMVSDADAVIWNARGELIMCSASPFGCQHQGWTIGQDYLNRVLRDGEAADTGIVSALYNEPRYVVTVPIQDGRDAVLGYVMVSFPTSDTERVIQRITEMYLTVAVVVVTLSVMVMSYIVHRQSRPLRQMARTANAFAHGELTARVELDSSYPRRSRSWPWPSITWPPPCRRANISARSSWPMCPTS